jgi:2-keto-4-pentenoate hydratase
MKTIIATLALLLAGTAASARTCDTDPRLPAIAAAWREGRQLPPLTIDPADAVCFRNALLRAVRPSLGPIVGYKVGAYTKAARASYGGAGPAVGILRKNMLLPPGKPVSVRIGFSPVAEPDFVVVIGDAGINAATTREEAYRHIRGIRPFIELPDNHYPADLKPDFARLMALDVNGLAGVTGPEVKLPQTPAGMAALTALTAHVTIHTPIGDVTQTGRATETLGDPIEIVLAARDMLRAEGIALKAGDLISLGTLYTPQRPVAGETLHVRYEMNDIVAAIEVRFVE